MDLLDILVDVLSAGPPIVLIIILALLVTYTSRWPLGIFTFISLLLIDNLGYWESSIQTLAIVILSGFLTILIGIPIGIWCAQNKTVQKIVMPILDFMQTMPAFVYLIPSILFFGIGVVPGIIASFIFAIAPTIRMTNLGIQEVPNDLIEASNAFGSTSSQKLFKVQITFGNSNDYGRGEPKYHACTINGCYGFISWSTWTWSRCLPGCQSN